MAEEKIAERIDANLLNVNVQELVDLPKVMFENKVNNLAKKTQGQLIIKEYPTATEQLMLDIFALFSTNLHLRSLSNLILYLWIISIFVPRRVTRDLPILIPILLLSRLQRSLEDWCRRSKVPIVSATQTTRSGYGSSDVELTDTSESFGLPATADLMFALISTEELEQLGQIMVKQLKNRYGDPTVNKRFIVGIDRAKMRLYDCEQTAQDDILDSGQTEEPESNFKNKFAELKF